MLKAMSAFHPERTFAGRVRLARWTERCILRADADGEDGGVERGEDKRHLPQAEHQGQQRDLGADHDIIGVADVFVGTARDEALARDDDDPRCPAVPERQTRSSRPLRCGAKG